MRSPLSARRFTPSRFTGPFVALVIAATAAGCTATLGSDSGFDENGSALGDGVQGPPDKPGSVLSISRDAVSIACEERNGVPGVGVTKVRRLSAVEFNNAVQSLFGGPYVDYSVELPDDEPMGPFVSNQSLPVGAQEARQYDAVAEIVAGDVLTRGTSFLPCPLPSGSETTCIETFIADAAPRAFRRALAPGESEALLDLYVVGRDGIEGDPIDPENGLRLLIRGLVGAPDSLYIVDTGVSGVPKDEPELASAFTLASRLSLAFWNAPPDAELLDLAASGGLLDDAVYRAQVERVLGDPRARDAVAHFFAQLTGVDELSHKEKDAALYPQWGTALVQEMSNEQSEFVTKTVFDGDGRLDTLLLTNHDAPGPLLATLYGVSGSAPVHLPPAERRGLFTQAAYLAAHNKAAETSPVHLGINIREAILCETMEPPPPGIDTTLPEKSENIQTTRDRFLAHEAGQCKACHELIDPLGLAFEHYDAIGQYRETDGGVMIDPTGQIISTATGEAGPTFTGALELTAQLAESMQVQDCVARQLLRSALDRQESLLDACTALEVVEGFDASGANIRQLLAQIASTEAFKTIVLNPPQESE